MPSTSTATSATHQAKRPYAGSHSQTQTQHQSTITSYFPFFSPQTSLFPSAIRNDTLIHTSSPALPPLVQSNLLSVGMRVRKSVPEGYKTGLPRNYNFYGGAVGGEGGGGGGAAAAAVALGWGPSNSASASPSPPLKTLASTTRRELTPFCGIMKVGGMAVQGWNYGAEQPDGGEVGADVLGVDVVPFLSSQGSTASATSVDSRTGYKRRFEEDEEEDEEEEEEEDEPGAAAAYDIWRDADNDDVQLSPKTRPVDLGLGLGLRMRALAVPKSRRKGRCGRDGRVKSAVLEGQENDDMAVLDVDFGEAEFMDWSACV